MAVIGELEYHLDNVVAEVYKRMLEIEIQTCTTNFRLRIAVQELYKVKFSWVLTTRITSLQLSKHLFSNGHSMILCISEAYTNGSQIEAPRDTCPNVLI